MGEGQGQANQPPHAEGKAKVKEAMAKHTSEQDRFRAGLNTILDNAKTIVNSGMSPTEMTSKIEEFRGHLDELWSEIHAK